MAILKIKEVGDEATVTIHSVEIVPSNDPKMGAQVKFETTDGDDLYVSEAAVERQLVRIGVANISDIPGQTIRFSRGANKNPKFPPYWNLDHASPLKAGAQPLLPNETGDEDYLPHQGDVEAVAGATAARYALAAPARHPGDEPGFDDTAFGQLCQKYRECISVAHEAWGKDCGDDALVAAAATLFIARNQQKI